ncbi:hypothetical protein POJ06DRAFT_264095 [Lipomyces tetrasporus]|uniref:Uncharacterized protein n=1 Tax=Lipomyces tetrasporus TaxID=54092 RepID=A0AAD7VP09_9ASCO|nr:uncharacterized protein POJ06DRAFT_264095 [Lipomyces tetrasporus]KAJ8096458.1 hypothetical protein POJ06DRAFT_264095 [Lipomyces tetrasporus]
MTDGHFSSSPTSQELSSLPRRSRRELDYYWLNDGSDEEAESQDRLPRSPRLAAQSKVDSSIDDVASNVFPEELASQLLTSTSVADTPSSNSKKSMLGAIAHEISNYRVSLYTSGLSFP